jgi:hypothetical protein
MPGASPPGWRRRAKSNAPLLVIVAPCSDSTGNFVAYYRVSTAQQGRSGLGLEAQQQAVRAYLDGGCWKLIGEHTEVESGKLRDRPQLKAALEQCRLTGATLVIAKLRPAEQERRVPGAAYGQHRRAVRGAAGRPIMMPEPRHGGAHSTIFWLAALAAVAALGFLPLAAIAARNAIRRSISG